MKAMILACSTGSSLKSVFGYFSGEPRDFLGTLFLTSIFHAALSLMPSSSPIFRSVRLCSVLIPFYDFVSVVSSIRFMCELAKLPVKIRSAWQKTEDMLRVNTWHAGLKFEKLKGWNAIFSVRVTKSIRATLRLSDAFEAIRLAGVFMGW